MSESFKQFGSCNDSERFSSVKLRFTIHNIEQTVTYGLDFDFGLVWFNI